MRGAHRQTMDVHAKRIAAIRILNQYETCETVGVGFSNDVPIDSRAIL